MIVYSSAFDGKTLVFLPCAVKLPRQRYRVLRGVICEARPIKRAGAARMIRFGQCPPRMNFLLDNFEDFKIYFFKVNLICVHPIL